MTANLLATQPQEFRSRRRRLIDSLTGGAIVIAAGHESPRNNDVDHQYRQDSSFWYLTGFDEPDAVAVLRPGSDTPYTLFVRPYDPTFEIWVGRRAGVRGAVGPLGANAAYPIDELDTQLPQPRFGIRHHLLRVGKRRPRGWDHLRTGEAAPTHGPTWSQEHPSHRGPDGSS